MPRPLGRAAGKGPESRCSRGLWRGSDRSEEHTSERQSPCNLVCRLLLEKKKIHIRSKQCNNPCGAKWRSLPLPFVRKPPLAIFFFFNDTATTEIYTLSLHDALPI